MKKVRRRYDDLLEMTKLSEGNSGDSRRAVPHGRDMPAESGLFDVLEWT